MTPAMPTDNDIAATAAIRLHLREELDLDISTGKVRPGTHLSGGVGGKQ
jgi:hypothetical protein